MKIGCYLLYVHNMYVATFSNNFIPIFIPSW